MRLVGTWVLKKAWSPQSTWAKSCFWIWKAKWVCCAPLGTGPGEVWLMSSVSLWHPCSLDSMGLEAASVCSVCGICRWCWQMLNSVLLNAACSLLAAWCWQKGWESRGRGAGKFDFHAWRKGSDPLWTAGAEMALELRGTADPGEAGGHRPYSCSQFPSSGWKHLLLPPPESLSLCFFVRRFWEATEFCSWWWIDLEDPLLIAQLQKLSESSVYLPSPFGARLHLQRREEKIKTPFLLTYKLIKPCLGATGYLFCGN